MASALGLLKTSNWLTSVSATSAMSGMTIDHSDILADQRSLEHLCEVHPLS